MNAITALERIPPDAEWQASRSVSVCPRNPELGPVVLEVVRQLDDSVLGLTPNPGQGLAFQPRVLLALIVYSYAAGVFASQDIESCLRSDPVLRLLCGPELPDSDTIRRFRRRHVQEVQRCLERSLGILNCAAFAGQCGDQGLLGDCQRTADHRSTRLFQSEELATEARSRVQWAVFLDSIALDD